MHTKEYLEECLNFFEIHQGIVPGDVKKFFLGLEYSHIKKRLSIDVLDYYFKNYENFVVFTKSNNLNIYKLTKYIKFCYYHQLDITQLQSNKKIVITSESCKQKIINTLKYDLDSFRIRFGNICLMVAKLESGVYHVLDDEYQLLYEIYLPQLQLIPVP